MSFKTRNPEVILILKGCGLVNDITNTLFVGIDVSKDSNQVCVLDFSSAKHGNFKSPNNKEGAEAIEQKLLDIVTKTKMRYIIIVQYISPLIYLCLKNFHLLIPLFIALILNRLVITNGVLPI